MLMNGGKLTEVEIFCHDVSLESNIDLHVCASEQL